MRPQRRENYCLRVEVEQHRLKVRRVSLGRIGGASIFFWIDPVEDLQVILMPQYTPFANLTRRELRASVYGGIYD